MGWEFAAVWADDPDCEGGWRWMWRRAADDSASTLDQSRRFATLEDCLDDARKHGFDEDGCPTS